MTNWESAYKRWKTNPNLDSSLKRELQELEQNKLALEDAFYKELTFGTGGLRGIIGAGTNRMNIYTIRKTVHGLAKYLLIHCVNVKDRGVVVSYDSRYMSKEFAIETAKVLGTFGIKTYIFNTLHPTPLLSFAVRYLGTVAGVMITASHNPPEYNGFKVYNEDGGQMVPNEANEVIASIRKVENEWVPVMDQQELEESGLLVWLDNEVDHAYLDRLKLVSKLEQEELLQKKELHVVFTSLHGTAHDLVLKGLKQLNFDSVDVVEEQVVPDPEFSTVESPNPEEHQAFTMAIQKGKAVDADLLLATDPDADRLGVAVKNNAGDYTVLTGNQLGSLMIDYILSHTDPVLRKNARVLQTIVTTELGQAVAASYGVETLNTLTGFKYIGEKIHQFDATGELFIFGYEESYGYLVDGFVRDKDAVQAAVMACEMAEYWKKQGKTLLDALEELYERFGYYREGLSSFTLKGKVGTEKIAIVMDAIRKEPLKEIAGLQVEWVEDYSTSQRTNLRSGQIETINLPKENVVKLILDRNCWVCLRPSGTEPKLKYYYGVCENSKETSEQQLQALEEAMNRIINHILA